MVRLRDYLTNNFERVYVLIILLSVPILHYFIPLKLAFVNFYFLPVIAAGYLVGMRFSILGALFCVLMVLLFIIIFPDQFVIPPSPEYLISYLLGWGGFLILSAAVVGWQHDKLRQEMEHTEQLNLEILDSHDRLLNANTTTIMGLAKLAEYRDEDTGQHLERLSEYCRVIANELARHPSLCEYITSDYIDDLCLSSVLHDIGKVGISDAVLQKPGQLTDDEFEQIKTHTWLGGDALKAIEKRIEGRSFLTLGKEVAYNHHERWDGKGYPRGITAEEIPLSARIISVADTYDAITTDRVYRPARSHEIAVDIIAEERSKQFDPGVVEAFLTNADTIGKIRERNAE